MAKKKYYEVLRHDDEEIVLKVNDLYLKASQVYKITNHPINVKCEVYKDDNTLLGENYLNITQLKYMTIENLIKKTDFMPYEEPPEKEGVRMYDIVKDLPINLFSTGVHGVIRKHFLRKTVIAYARERHTALVLARMPGDNYLPVFFQWYDVPDGVPYNVVQVRRCGRKIQKILDRLHEMTRYTSCYMLPNGDERARLTARMV